MKPEQNQQTHYLKDKNVAARYDIDRTTVWRWVSEGRLPTPHKTHGVTRSVTASSSVQNHGKQNPFIYK